MPVHWDYQNQSLPESAETAPALGSYPVPQASPLGRPLHYRRLMRGRVLEVNTLQGPFSGRYRCRTLVNSTRHVLSAWIYVRSEGECCFPPRVEGRGCTGGTRCSLTGNALQTWRH